MIPRNDEIKAAARTSLSGHYTPIVMAFLTAEMILWLFGTFLSGPSRTAFGRLTSMVLSFVISVILLVIDAGFHYMYLQLASHRLIRSQICSAVSDGSQTLRSGLHSCSVF